MGDDPRHRSPGAHVEDRAAAARPSPENIPVYASQGALLPLDDWYDAADSGASTLNEQAVATGIVDGERYGAPLSFTPLAMFYNKALFDAAGVAVPTTWDEWVAAAKELTVDDDGDGTPEQYGLALADHATVGNGVWMSLFKSGGGDVVTADGEVVVDSPRTSRPCRTGPTRSATTRSPPPGSRASTPTACSARVRRR